MKLSSKFTIASLAALIAGASYAEACSRVTYTGPAQAVVTGRSMDWMQETKTNLWAYPAGIARNGAAKENPLTWTSKYGSVTAAAYDSATADGINEKGLVANLLYLGTADYGVRNPKRPGLSIAGWAQYVLDNFATVAEAVKALKEEPFQLVSPTLPGNHPPVMHLAISDPTGDSAIFEYIAGKLVFHHGKAHAVMTNEPSYDQQLALNAYWKEIGGDAMLPGTERPADRFVRASYYLGKANPASDSTAVMFSIMRNISVPLSLPSNPGAPNVAQTLWRTVSDHKNRIYYFESTTSPNVIWVDLEKMDFKPGNLTKKLTTYEKEPVKIPVWIGETSAGFAPAEPFQFMPEKG